MPAALWCQPQIALAQIALAFIKRSRLHSCLRRGVSEVLEEVAPVAMRGKQINDGSFQSGCNVDRFTDYENVWIMRTPPRPCRLSS